MGFLRKVGKKIKKGIKKLFSSKLGSIVGMIGLYYAMGAVGKAFLQSPTAPPVGAEGVVETAGKKALEDVAGKEVVKGAASNVELANNTVNAIDKAAQAGNLNTATTSITDAVSKTNMEIFKEGLGKIGQGIKDLPSKTGEFLADLPTKIAEAPGKAYEYVTGSEFLPDVAQGAATSFVTSEIMGEPEEPFISGGVMPQPTMEAAQGAYISEVSNQLPQFQGTNFQQLNQSLFYGTLSPQYLMSQIG
jgi:hypothetical protein